MYASNYSGQILPITALTNNADVELIFEGDKYMLNVSGKMMFLVYAKYCQKSLLNNINCSLIEFS